MTGFATFGLALLVGATVCLTSGCSTLTYYTQSVGGHLALVNAARPVPQWLADENAAPALKERLALSQRIRDFAIAELHLPDNASYRRYAHLERPAAVWNVVAAPELSLTLQTWCFPVVGCIGYRGYFDHAQADAFAAEERARGFEVNVYPVPAYSTLGALPGDWFADPLLSTFIDFPEGELARLVFHELAHQVVYVAGDTAFNESFATAVERIGGQRWLVERAGDKSRADHAEFESRRRDFRELTRSYRDRLAGLYASAASDADKRSSKAELMQRLRADFESMKRERWGGFAGYDGWFARANNAAFGVLSAYTELAPGFERLFEREGRDFPRFYAAVRRIAALEKDARRAVLTR